MVDPHTVVVVVEEEEVVVDKVVGVVAGEADVVVDVDVVDEAEVLALLVEDFVAFVELVAVV